MKTDELFLLLLRNAIVNKEIENTHMNYEMNRYGEWQCDHPTAIRELDREIDELIKKLDHLKYE